MIQQEELVAAIAAAQLVMLLGISSITDIISHKIPNAVLLPALAAAVVLGSIGHGSAGLAAALCGLLVGLAMLLPLYVAGGTAAGDVKLLGVAGAFLGPTGAFFAGLFTFIVGAALGLLWIAWRNWHVTAGRQALGVPHLDVHSTDLHTSGSRTGMSATFAYAPAIAAGALLAAWYQGWQFFGV
jgi:prepilin peptidase CpaA